MLVVTISPRVLNISGSAYMVNSQTNAMLVEY